MDIDKLAHALGVVFCRPPLGELDLAPGPMHVDADEEIDGAVAAGLNRNLRADPARPGSAGAPPRPSGPGAPRNPPPAALDPAPPHRRRAPLPCRPPHRPA